MLPHKVVVDGDIGELWLRAIGSQEAQPMLGGDHKVWVRGVLGQVQRVQELLALSGTQRVDVLTHHRDLWLLAVRTRPAELTLSAVRTRKVSFGGERQTERWGGAEEVSTCIIQPLK